MSKPVAMALIVPLACTALCMTGCDTTRPPETSVTEARVVASTDEAVVIEFTIKAQNDNPDALPLRRIDYTLSLDGRQVFSGSRSPEGTIRREGEQIIRVPASIKLEPGQRDGKPYAISGAITYQQPGKVAEILYEYEVIQPTIRFSGTGTVDLSAKP